MNKAVTSNFFSQLGKLFSFNSVSFSPIQTHNFALITSLQQLEATQIMDTDALIIDTNTSEEALTLLHNIRSAWQREIYLKPIFVQSPELYEKLKHLVDGLYLNNQLPEAKAHAKSINQRIENIKVDALKRDMKSNLLVKTTQYLYTRGEKYLKPYPSKYSPINYSFPFINSFIATEENLNVLQILEVGVQEEWFEKVVIGKEVVNQKVVEITEFSFTLMGEQLAISGYFELPKSKLLPEGILSLPAFQSKVADQIADIKAGKHQSFLINIGLIQENLSFLSNADQDDLTLTCLKMVQEMEGQEDALTLTPQNKLWLLLPDATETTSIKKAQRIFGNLQQKIREILDIDQPILELNMIRVQDCMPTIR